jgi:trehalose 6-phosphate synthase
VTSPGRAPLLVASNRGPLSVVAVEGGEDEVRRGSGGLVSGMQAALAASEDAVWVCAAMNDRERAVARETERGRLSQHAVVGESLHGDFDVRMLPIDATTFRNAYNGVANSTLWFVLHMLYDLPRQPAFDRTWRRQWDSYVRFNRAFAEALAEEAAPNATVMVQDYHLFLVPRMLKDLRDDVRIGLFTHTAWVPADYVKILPDDVSVALVEGIVAADVVGFHTRRWADLFDDTAAAILGRKAGNTAVFPLGTDADALRARAAQRDVEQALRRLNHVVGDRQVIGRVDRTELSKNVWRGLLAFRELLRRHPEWRGKVVHTVYNNPSREDLPAYREYTAAIERLAEDVIEEFGTDDWTPLVLEIVEDYPAALASLRRSDVVFVNSVRDGMNLVVQEGVLLSERDPAVVLSRETGALELLGEDAILVNPFDVTEQAEALNRALLMSREDRAPRVARMRDAVVKLPPDAWFQAQLAAVSS